MVVSYSFFEFQTPAAFVNNLTQRTLRFAQRAQRISLHSINYYTKDTEEDGVSQSQIIKFKKSLCPLR